MLLLIIGGPLYLYCVVKNLRWRRLFNQLKEKPNFELFWANYGEAYYNELYKGSHESLTHFALGMAGDIAGGISEAREKDRLRNIERHVRGH